VHAFLKAIDRTTPMGRRDYATFLLIATYGLRAREVVTLTLEDIEWRAKRLRISQLKTRGSRWPPLTNEVGTALLDYLRHRRPSLAVRRRRVPFRGGPPRTYRELFLRHRTPMGVLKPAALSDAFHAWSTRSGLAIPFYGAHCLRHSYAVYLLRSGLSLKTIGDLLGHRTLDSTCVYLRLAVEDLRDVALDLPAGVDGLAMGGGVMTAMTFGSVVASTMRSYLTLKRALGRQYAAEERVLARLDRFLASHHADLTAETFAGWCLTLQHLASGNRRGHMRDVRNLCLYRRRREPGCFVPDERLFPPVHQVIRPHVFTAGQLAQLLAAARTLTRTANSPLCPETMRLAIVFLYTTGLRRGELTRLTVADCDPRERTVTIRISEFHKSRLAPVSNAAAHEIDGLLERRRQQRLPTEADSPLLWHRNRGYSGGGLGGAMRALFRQVGIRTSTGHVAPVGSRPGCVRAAIAFSLLRVLPTCIRGRHGVLETGERAFPRPVAEHEERALVAFPPCRHEDDVGRLRGQRHHALAVQDRLARFE
jgi:integrase